MPTGKVPRIFRNSYTRGGRRYLTDGWVVKLQHCGERRTVSLRAKTKAAAGAEARTIAKLLLSKGWEAVRQAYGIAQNGNTHSKSATENWRQRLLVRRYHFPASASPEGALSVRIEHGGLGYWFPLGTAEVEDATAKAQQIYETVIHRGWDECCRRFSRELIVGFEWHSNPILWTYATIHTMAGGAATAPARFDSRGGRIVVIAEQDPGIRQALEWCLTRQTGLQPVACDSKGSFERTVATSQPCLALVNRKLAERLGLQSPGQLAPLRSGGLPALTYSLAPDGDQLFVSTPGGAEGYVLKRVKPDRVLEPIFQGGSGFPNISATELTSRVKSYFKELLQPRRGESDPAISRLTRREIEVLDLLSKGCVDKEIAQALGISAWTVHGHIKSIFERLRARTRTEAVVRYLEK